MTTSVTVRACSNPRTRVTVEIRDHVADGDDVVTENQIAPGATSVPYYATTTRSILVREDIVEDAAATADVIDADTVAELAAG